MENNYGNCQYCNAPKVKSPKTGKIFCSDKCWLKNNPSPNAQKQPVNGFSQPRRDIDPNLIIVEKLDEIIQILKTNFPDIPKGFED